MKVSADSVGLPCEPRVDPLSVNQPGGLRRLGWSVLRIYVMLLLMLMLLERTMIFQPSVWPEGHWTPASLVFEDAWFTTEDGVQLHGWYCAHPDPRAVVLYCHGNAGNLSHRAERLQELLSLNVSVMIFDYRGYGRSAGSPDEAGILADARAARKWLATRIARPEAEIVLMGRSLGGGVAVDLAARDGARALILESTFTSLPDVAAVHYPWVPVRWLMRTRLDSLSKISKYRGPLLISHGTADEVVPYRLGKGLFAAANEPKQFLAIEGGMHNDLTAREYLETLQTFFAGLP